MYVFFQLNTLHVISEMNISKLITCTGKTTDRQNTRKNTNTIKVALAKNTQHSKDEKSTQTDANTARWL